MMSSRPKSGENEDDLLKLQQEFLKSVAEGHPSGEVKRVEKRKTNGLEDKRRDVVKMEAETDVPAKKYRSHSQQTCRSETGVRRELSAAWRRKDDVNIEEALDSNDTGLAAVLANIIERDTRNEMFVTPVLSKQAFPVATHIEQAQKEKSTKTEILTQRKKKSLFAQQVETHSTRVFGVEPVSHRSLYKTKTSSHIGLPHSAVSTAKPCLIDGSGLGVSCGWSESQKIHEENMDKLSAMSKEEILQEQHRLIQMLDPKLVAFLKSKREAEEELTKSPPAHSCKEICDSVKKEMKRRQKSQNKTGTESEELPVKPSNVWVHMDAVEKEKLEWIRDLPPPPSISAQIDRPARFDFKGNLMAVDADIPINIGLHHHGEEPERAGYTLEELFLLVRSSNLQQRNLALHTLARVMDQAKCGYLHNKIQTPIIPAIVAGGIVMLLRWALDDSVKGTVVAAIDALHSLLCNSLDEEAIDATWACYQGHLIVTLTPFGTLEREAQSDDTDEENKEEETDVDVIKRDVVEALVLRMALLVRFRYIFQSMKPQATTVVQMLAILSRISQHSSSMVYEILKCPDLVPTIVREFLPTAWTSLESGKALSQIYGLPVSAAMRFLRVLCQAGRNIASTVISQFRLDEILLRYLAVQSSDLQLPQKEIIALQAESLAVWRVCAAYGFMMQTYFDMYSSILQSVGHLENRWHMFASARVDRKVENLCIFDVYLLCVLERILFVAGSTQSRQPRFNSLDNERTVVTAFPSTNWSHVTAFLQPVRACTVDILNDVATRYPVKKHCLALPVACLNFLSSYWEVEGRQSARDVVSGLEVIEHFSNTSIISLWSSYGLSIIIESMSCHSNLLASESAVNTEIAVNLPSLGVCKVAAQTEDVASTNPDMWKTNMPILLPHSPFGFLVALLKLMLTVCKRHKSLISKLMGLVANRKDILKYMAKTCSVSKSTFKSAFFTREEYLFHYYWLKCCTLMSYESKSLTSEIRILAHRVALQLVARVHHGNEHIIHELLSSVIFSPHFLSEGEEINLTSQALEVLNLSENLHLMSATQEEMNISRHQLLLEAFSSLPKIRGDFLRAFGGMEKTLQESRNLFMGNPQEIQSQFIKNADESLMPRDWMFVPLIHIYIKSTQLQVTGNNNSPETLATVISVLQWSYMLEIWRPIEMELISVTLRLTRVMCTFIAGIDLFLEKPVNQYLAGLLRVFTSPRLLNRLDFDEKIPGITSFYDLYQEFLDHYEGVSFGDTVFGLYVLVPLQQKHNSIFKKAVWGERRKLLRTLRVPLGEMLIPLQNYLYPDETDIELLQLYLSALLTKAVRPVWSPVMYLIAVHHVNRFLFVSHDDSNLTVRDHMWKQILVLENQMSDVIYYKQANTDLPGGIELYGTLPKSREVALEKIKNEKSV